MDLFTRFVQPMEQALKSEILIPYKLINEGELFCSDFKYRFSDAKTQDFMGVVGKSSEDTINEIQDILNKIINKYRKAYLEYCDEKVGENKRNSFIKNISKALYFVSNLEIENAESQRLARDNEQLADLWNAKKSAKAQEIEDRGAVKQIQEEIRDFNMYK